MNISNYLIIGSGIAGLSLALKAAIHGSVLIVTKDRLPESNSAYAQGGIASVWSAEDSFAAHVQDTLTAGAGLCHADVVEAVVREGPDRIRELIALGTNFSRRPGGEEAEYDLGLEGGHWPGNHPGSHRRSAAATEHYDLGKTPEYRPTDWRRTIGAGVLGCLCIGPGDKPGQDAHRPGDSAL